MQPQRDYIQRVGFFDAATMRLLLSCSQNELAASIVPLNAATKEITSMQHERDCYLDTATTKELRLMEPQRAASMKPKRWGWFDAASTKYLPLCSHNEIAASMQPN